MNKIIKHRWEERNDIFFSSDWHNFHDPKWPTPIWQMRGYASPQESLDDVANKINARVGRNSILYFLGDGFLNTTDEQVLEWFKRIECRNIRLLFGNHESQVYRVYKKAVQEKYGFEDVEVYPLQVDNLMFLGNYQEIQIGKKGIVLQHFPLRTWNWNSKGSWHLHGHSHNTDQTRNPEYHMGKCLDCSWEYKKDIWSFSEIEEVMSTKEIQINDHH
jgi:calcineurin-like phosphoesterase family protein